MKKITLLILFFIPIISFSQSNAETIQRYLNSKTAKLDVSNADVKDWIIESEGNSTTTNINNCYVLQRYQGIEVFRALSNFSIKEGQVINLGNRFVANLSQKVNATKPSLSVLDALAKTYLKLDITAIAPFTILEKTGQYKFKISNGLSIEEPVSANLVYHLTKENTLKLAWDFTINTVAHNHIWSVRVDALNGEILEKNDLNISCNFDSKKHYSSANNILMKPAKATYKQLFSAAPMYAGGGSYNVIPFNYESPNHSARRLISNPANATASPYGWHDIDGFDGAEFTVTRGNNVWAKEDFLGDNIVVGNGPDGGAGLVFDFPYGGTGVEAASYISAATTNLFYMNNVMHDIWYQYGFNEASGNFQENNYSRGGKENDFVNADAQDGSMADPQSTNNANFATPVDGGKPRMQMFLWNTGPEIKPIIVNSPQNIAGSYVAKQNSFNPGRVDLPIAPNFIQSDLVLYLDSVGGSSDACVAPSNEAAMNKKIVVIRRGSCTFVVKVKAAQNAGAVAVIIVNNADGAITMSGADASIKIPAISVTQAVGESLIAQMQTQNVNVNLQVENSPFVNSDGDFDNGIIAHEYGHGISTRLAGGRNNSSCLQNTDQMGEGWSDWFALMLQIKPGDVGTSKRGIGTFVSMQSTDGLGIRDYPYSTDRAINPMTYAQTNKYQYMDKDGVEQTEIHGTGSVWTTVLWDLTWAYINKYGYDDNKYTGIGGNNKLMRIVLDGIKLMPCSPTFVSARDAIIAADQAITGGKDYCMIWGVFAARGLGVNASAGDGNIGNDQVEDFAAPAAGPNCVLAVNDFESNEGMSVYPNPSSGQVNLHIDQYVGKVTIQIIDINGRVVAKFKNEEFNNLKTIDLSRLQKGVYILKVNSDNLEFTEKIILN
ncbi:T9SS-dependent M36 family metallopeptidase [Flavobacterium xinjiangense]|uniref:Por secretion system C-terminal sorting domain-containing protein n=1 Tax=Flavobacterium xinjiangense TaxID=178356 RepID=A0A1M7EGB5_9FLAO|nr:T9SS-dependent M36 family metallopeptidase [Flavobacterium xinjiangense]SHL90831.1 Por secretion system C-terminal sorting domain-containing protein [Flavobacterium xinjiangense]